MAQKTEQTKQVVKFDNIADQVLQKIEGFVKDGGLRLPENYSVANNMKSAWLVLQETTDRNNKPALEVCTKATIANALFEEGNPSGVKAALEIQGIIESSAVRLPLVKVSKTLYNKLSQLVATVNE